MSFEVRSVENLLGTPVPYAYAVKAGPWLFLTGHEAYDWRTGMVDERDRPATRCLATTTRAAGRPISSSTGCAACSPNSAPISRTVSG